MNSSFGAFAAQPRAESPLSLSSDMDVEYNQAPSSDEETPVSNRRRQRGHDQINRGKKRSAPSVDVTPGNTPGRRQMAYEVQSDGSIVSPLDPRHSTSYRAEDVVARRKRKAVSFIGSFCLTSDIYNIGQL